VSEREGVTEIVVQTRRTEIERESHAERDREREKKRELYIESTNSGHFIMLPDIVPPTKFPSSSLFFATVALFLILLLSLSFSLSFSYSLFTVCSAVLSSKTAGS
jgi:hypothetical protein